MMKLSEILRDKTFECDEEMLNMAADKAEGLEDNNAELLEAYEAIKQTAGELALILWDAVPPNEISKENTKMLDALEYIAQFNDAAIAGNPTAIRKRAEEAIRKAKGD